MSREVTAFDRYLAKQMRNPVFAVVYTWLRLKRKLGEWLLS